MACCWNDIWCGVQDVAVLEEDPFQGAGVPVMENGPQDGLEDTMVAPEDATESLLAATEPTSHASTPDAPPAGVPPAPETMTVPGGTGQPEAAEEEEGQGTPWQVAAQPFATCCTLLTILLWLLFACAPLNARLLSIRLLALVTELMIHIC